MLAPRNLIIYMCYLSNRRVKGYYRSAFRFGQEKSPACSLYNRERKMEILPELIDSHAHLDSPEFVEDIPSVLARAAKVGVKNVITIGTDMESSRKAAALAVEYDCLHAAAGIHPHESFIPNDGEIEDLAKIAGLPRVVAIGEIGLDYYYDMQPRGTQQACMTLQLKLAVRIGKPVVFHIRDSWEDFFRIVPQYLSQLPPSVMHCFSGDWEIAERCLDMGMYLSIPGIITFSKADGLRDAVVRAPLDRLLVETDSPYLAPVPYRGKTNEPSFVCHTARKIAEIRGEPYQTIAARTTQNARTVFGF